MLHVGAVLCHLIKVGREVERIPMNTGGIPTLLIGEEDNYVWLVAAILWHGGE
jgi:hypothetical protein